MARGRHEPPHYHYMVGPCPICGSEIEVCGQPCFIFCPIDQTVLRISWGDDYVPEYDDE